MMKYNEVLFVDVGLAIGHVVVEFLMYFHVRCVHGSLDRKC